MPYTPWLPQEHGGEPTAAAAYATAEAAAKARGINICGEVRGDMTCSECSSVVMALAICIQLTSVAVSPHDTLVAPHQFA